MFRMLAKKREYYLGSGDLLRFRVWTAVANSVMQGLTHDDNKEQEVPSSVPAFLALNRFESARDEENRGSGFTPLILAAVSGNLPIVRELIDSKGVDVRARVRVAVHELGTEKGMDALALAAGACPQRHVHDVVTALLAAGADPNAYSSSGSGATPLIVALSLHNLGGVCALLACKKLDIEKGLRVNHASPLGIACFLSTFEIIQALVEAGANKGHKCVCGDAVAGDRCMC